MYSCDSLYFIRQLDLRTSSVLVLYIHAYGVLGTVANGGNESL